MTKPSLFRVELNFVPGATNTLIVSAINELLALAFVRDHWCSGPTARRVLSLTRYDNTEFHDAHGYPEPSDIDEPVFGGRQ